MREDGSSGRDLVTLIVTRAFDLVTTMVKSVGDHRVVITGIVGVSAVYIVECLTTAPDERRLTEFGGVVAGIVGSVLFTLAGYLLALLVALVLGAALYSANKRIQAQGKTLAKAKDQRDPNRSSSTRLEELAQQSQDDISQDDASEHDGQAIPKTDAVTQEIEVPSYPPGREEKSA